MGVGKMNKKIQKSMSSIDGAFVNDLTTGNIPSQLISFAAPLFLSGILQSVYNLADMAIVGRVVGSASLASVSTGGDLMMFLTFVAVGFSNAAQVLISRFVGADRRDLAGRLIGTTFTCLLACAAVLTLISLALCENIVVWTQVPEESSVYAYSYIATCACGLVFIYGYNAASAIFRGVGDSRHPFLFIGVAAAVNIVLDLFFVVVLRWAVFGAALATVISQGISFIMAVTFLYRRRGEIHFSFRLLEFRLDKELFGPFVRLGIPMMLQMAGVTFSKLFVSSWVNSYGIIPAALNGIGNKLYTVTTAYSSALSTSCGSMIAQNLGAKKLERVPKIILSAFIVGGALAAIIALPTILFPKAVFGLFTNDEAVLSMAVGGFIPVIIFYYFSGSVRAPMLGLINGTVAAKLNLTIALLDGVAVRIGLALIMGITLKMGAFGFWYGSAIAGYIPFVIGSAYYFKGKWKAKDYTPKAVKLEDNA
jgi:putative MATE family efflux protein